MLNPADVNKLACLFIEKTVSHFVRKKYSVSSVLDKRYFNNYVMGTELEHCLEYEDECNLLHSVEDVEIDDTVVITPCDNPFTISATLSTSSCTADNFYFGGTVYPSIALSNNSYYHDATSPLLYTDGCTGNLRTAGTARLGKVRTGALTASAFDNNVMLRFDTHFDITSGLTATAMPLGSVHKIKLTATDANGAGATTTTHQIDPSTVSTGVWTSCATCEAIDWTHLLFGASATNYVTAFTKLLKNVSRTLYGGLFIEPIVFRDPAAGTLSVHTLIKHNPTSRQVGIDVNNASITYDTNGSLNLVTKNFVPRSEAVVGTWFASCAETGSIITICPNGSTTSRAILIYGNFSSSSIPVDTAQSNWNFVKLTALNIGNSSSALTFETAVGSNVCNTYLVTATVSPDIAGTTYRWSNAGDTTLSTSKTVYLTTAATYTFTATTPSGCAQTYEYVFTIPA